MTWEETIEYIREDASYSELVKKAFFDKDLELNVSRFENGEEFEEILNLVRNYAPNAKSILDIGAGNGISSVAFAKKGYHVHAVEPDSSTTIGAGAIRILKESLKLERLKVYESFAEDIQFDTGSFDVVFVRQAMHHANDLNKFILESSRVLRQGGLLLTVRDHVIYDEIDKDWFFDSHPLHKFYGGENAYTHEQYSKAFEKAGIEINVVLKHYDSVINYYPLTKNEFMNRQKDKEKSIHDSLKKKIGFFAGINFVKRLYYKRIGYNALSLFDENKVPGRMYSYVGIKK